MYEQPSFPTRDWLTQSGAAELARSIERYWENKGRAGVVCAVTQTGKFQWVVRSNLVNALPPKGE